MPIKSFLKPYYHAFKLTRKYPTSERVKVFFDFLSLYRLKGLTWEEYFDFEFENRDEDFRRSFLGLNEQRYYLDYLNPLKYYSLARNKYLAHKVLDNTGVRKAELYCYYQPEARYIIEDGIASDLEGVLTVLKKKDVKSCVIKTTESSHGDNVCVINAIVYKDNDAVLYRFDGQNLLLSSALGKEALIFESVVFQTKQFSSFNESSVNTVRFMTTLFPDKTVKIIAAFLKIGRDGRCVDNAGNGGNVDVCVDVESGELQYAIQFDGWRRIKAIDRHPDNDSSINGVFIENWQSIKDELRKYQQAFPFCKAVGWDIAITDDGPVVIEINDFWDRTGQYFIHRGWRNEIRTCYQAWRQTGKSYAVGSLRLPFEERKLIRRFNEY